MYDTHIALQLASARINKNLFAISSHLKLIFYKLNLYSTMDTYIQNKFFYTLSEEKQQNKVKIHTAVF